MTGQDDKEKRMIDFLNLRMSQMHSYHDHKENMAHAAVVVALGLVGAVLSIQTWPPSWVPSLCVSSKTMAFIGIVAVWLLIHVYMRWQLRNRRVAAIYVAALLKVLRAWATSPPTEEQLKAWEQDPLPRVKIHDFINFLIPWKRSNVTADEELKGYPTAFVKELQQSSTGAVWSEYIVTYGSLLLGLFLVVRTLP